jgi:5,10-methylenetetrahydrofolate reductase
MKIIYELNPPKILHGESFNLSILSQEIEKFLSRASIVLGITRHVHLTDSVLGIPRLSSITAAQLISKEIESPIINLTCSIRTRDRNMNSIIQSVADSVILRIKGLLFIQGDKPSYGSLDISTGSPKPTEVINTLNSLGFGDLINLDLSIPNEISNISNFRKKIRSKPSKFITQSISSIEEIRKLKSMLETECLREDNNNNTKEGISKISLIPCIMVPSAKNQKAANMIGLDWSLYEHNFYEFIEKIGDLGINEILLTSPNSFDEGISVLKKISN